MQLPSVRSLKANPLALSPTAARSLQSGYLLSYQAKLGDSPLGSVWTEEDDLVTSLSQVCMHVSEGPPPIEGAMSPSLTPSTTPPPVPHRHQYHSATSTTPPPGPHCHMEAKPVSPCPEHPVSPCPEHPVALSYDISTNHYIQLSPLPLTHACMHTLTCARGMHACTCLHAHRLAPGAGARVASFPESSSVASTTGRDSLSLTALLHN